MIQCNLVKSTRRFQAFASGGQGGVNDNVTLGAFFDALSASLVACYYSEQGTITYSSLVSFGNVTSA